MTNLRVGNNTEHIRAKAKEQSIVITVRRIR